MHDPIIRRVFHLLAWAGILLLATLSPAAGRSLNRPNIVFIMADDLGWRDLGCYGSTYFQTPAIDQLASRGMRFTNAYSASPQCSPTRASLLSGLWPAETGLTGASGHEPQVRLQAALQTFTPDHQKSIGVKSASRLDQAYLTYAEIFQWVGYKTMHLGKWHVGSPPYSALQQGFHLDIPHSSASGPLPDGYFHPWPVWPGQGQPGDHLEERMAEEAVQFIETMAEEESPFFLQYWMWEVHSPYQDYPQRIAKYDKRADPDNPQRNPVYAAMVETMDQAVASVVEALERTGQMENTVLFFYSDNGGWIVPLDRFIPEPYRGLPVTSNHPLRGGKATLYEGGTRVPLIAVWPGQIKPNSVNHTVVTSVDFFPTFMELLNIQFPGKFPLDGSSFRPALRGQFQEREPIFCHFPHNVGNLTKAGTYVRRGKWKLIRFYAQGENQSDKLELYNLEEDLGETRNRTGDYPELAREFNALIEKHLEETGAVVPVPNPDYRGP